MPLLLATLALSVVLTVLPPPGGYLVFEFPALFTSPEFDPAGWTAVQREQAYFGLGLDYLYLVAYSLLLSRWCQALARRLPAISTMGSSLRRAARWVWVAATFDAAENTGLYFWLGGISKKTLTIAVSVCAGLKFLIVALVLLALLIGVLVSRSRRRYS